MEFLRQAKSRCRLAEKIVGAIVHPGFFLLGSTELDAEGLLPFDDAHLDLEFSSRLLLVVVECDPKLSRVSPCFHGPQSLVDHILFALQDNTACE